MTTLRLPALLQQNRALGDLPNLSDRSAGRPELAPRNRPSFGDSLREASQQRSDQLKADRTEEAENLAAEDNADEDNGVSASDAVDADDDVSDDSQATAGEVPIRVVATEQSAPTSGVLQPANARESQPDPYSANAQSQQVAVVDEGASGDQEPTEEIEAARNTAVTATRSVESGLPAGADAVASRPNDRAANTVVVEGSLRSTAEGSTTNNVTSSATRSANEASAQPSAGRDTANSQTQQDQQRSSASSAPSGQSAGIAGASGDDAVSTTTESTSARPSDQIAQSVQRAAERDHQRGDRQEPRRAPAIRRALQLQSGLLIEQFSGTRLQGAHVPGSASDVLVATIAGDGGQPMLAGTTTDSASSSRQMLPDATLDRVVSSRIVRGLSSMLQQRGGTMTMRLDPPELGQLRVQMSITRGVVNAQFMPATQQAQQLIERNMATLRAALEGQGLNVERLTVQGPASSSSGQSTSNTGHDANQQQTGQQHQSDAGQGESRGRERFERHLESTAFDRLANANAGESFDVRVKEAAQ